MMSTTASASATTTTVQDTTNSTVINSASKSSTTGPSRFRGDSPSFSPGQQKISANPQQHHQQILQNSLQHHQHHPQHHQLHPTQQQQQQQQHLHHAHPRTLPHQDQHSDDVHQPHMQQIYSQASPYSSHQQQMQYMSQYDAYQPVVYPSMYMPMYSHDVMYQNQMYMLQQQSQVPQVPHHFPPHFTQASHHISHNNGVNNHNPRKRVNGNQYAAKVSTAPKFIPSSALNSATITTPPVAKVKSSKVPSSASGKIEITKPASTGSASPTKPVEVQTALPDRNSTNNTNNDTHELDNDNNNSTNTIQPQPQSPKGKSNSVPSSLPVTPSVSLAASVPHTPIPSNANTAKSPTSGALDISYPIYFNSSAGDFQKSFDIIQRKELVQQKYNRLNSLDVVNTKAFSVETGSIRLINYNTRESKIVNEGYIHKDEVTASKDDLKSGSLPTINWAAALQSSASTPKKSISKSKVSNGSVNGASDEAGEVLPSSTKAVKATDFDIRNESVQPLGILILRIMFDANYSVLNTENDLPVFKVTPRGLTNTGNICYMNSILQVMIYCQPFNKLLKLVNDKAIGSLSKVSASPLLDASIKFLNEFVEKPSENGKISKVFTEANKPLSPENFYMNLISHPKFQHLKWGQQEDAEEFLGYYLDGLHEEFLQAVKSLNTSSIDSLIQQYSSENSGDVERTNQFKYDIKTSVKIIKNDKSGSANSAQESSEPTENEWNEVGSNKKISVKRTVEIEPTPITMIFGGQFKSVLTIPKAPNSSQYSKSITLDPFQHVQLDISESTSIEEAFAHLNNVEKISYKTKEQKEIQIKKQTFIDKLPEVLIIHLKRFSFLKEKDVGIEKLRKKIVYTHNMSISPEVLSNKNLENVYKLTGVVYHHGANAQGGHYTSDVLRQSGKSGDDSPADEWIRIDDTMLKSITDDEVLNGGVEENIKNAYILVYERCV